MLNFLRQMSGQQMSRRAFLLYFWKRRNNSVVSATFKVQISKAPPAFHEHFWKSSTRPNDFSDPNLVIPHIYPDPGSAVWLSPCYDPIIKK